MAALARNTVEARTIKIIIGSRLLRRDTAGVRHQGVRHRAEPPARLVKALVVARRYAEVGSGGAAVAFRHAAYQEVLAAEFLRTAEGRAAAATVASRPRLTEQVR
jgi:hypothetical protein